MVPEPHRHDKPASHSGVLLLVLWFCVFGGVLRRGFAAGFCGGVLRRGSAAGFCGGVLRRGFAAGFCGGVLRRGFAAGFCGGVLRFCGFAVLRGWVGFSAEAIFASSTSKSGVRIPFLEREDLRSSTNSTVSTSLIQCIASVGNCEQIHTSVLNFIFQQANFVECREFVEMKIRNLHSLLVCPIIL